MIGSGPVCHQNALKSVTLIEEWMRAYAGMTQKETAGIRVES